MNTLSDLYRDAARQQIAVAQHAHLQQPLDQLLANSGELAIDTAGALSAIASVARNGGQMKFAEQLTALTEQLVDYAANVVEAVDQVTARDAELQADIDAALDAALLERGITD